MLSVPSDSGPSNSCAWPRRPPASALTASDKGPAVWVVDPVTFIVALKSVEVLSFDPGTVVVSAGLDGGEIVVTAGVQALHPGQKVRLLGAQQ